jgi:hypothetical protein
MKDLYIKLNKLGDEYHGGKLNFAKKFLTAGHIQGEIMDLSRRLDGSFQRFLVSFLKSFSDSYSPIP